MTKFSFKQLGLSARPVMLAPLAGVSDHPFRRICSRYGADLTFVEMLSATALNFRNRRTLTMLKRHESEDKLAVQLTGRNADEIAAAIAILNDFPFESVDINMGCPVRKVVQQGCGSALLRNPDSVYETVCKAVAATDRPVSVKIRLGWDRQSINVDEVAAAVEAGGAAWLTIHGRTRSDDYSVPVDLLAMARVKRARSLPIIGNGNLFQFKDAEHMLQATKVDGLMVSRGALGDPWVFRRLAGDAAPVTLDEWQSAVNDHLTWQAEEYGDTGAGAICMRKHVLWYSKGWPGGKRLREDLQQATTIEAMRGMLDTFCEQLLRDGRVTRSDASGDGDVEGRFTWDPKWDMDRQLDRGIADTTV